MCQRGEASWPSAPLARWRYGACCPGPARLPLIRERGQRIIDRYRRVLPGPARLPLIPARARPRRFAPVEFGLQ